MIRRRAAVMVLAGAALVSAGSALAATPDLRVSSTPTAVKTSIGRKFAIRTAVSNDGGASTPRLIAHLNVLSLDGSVYVDPEDWSSNRTRYLDSIPAHGSRALTWKVQAVNSGSIGIYVAVLTRSGALRAPATGPTVRVTIGRRQTLNAGGILPLALGIPALLALLAATLRIGRRRQGG